MYESSNAHIQKAVDALIQLAGNYSTGMDEVFKTFSFKEFPSKTYLTRAGEEVDHVIFISEGALRFYFEDENGDENTTILSFENTFVCDYPAFLNKDKSMLTAEALEPCKVVMMPRDPILKSYKENFEANTIGRKIAEFYLSEYDRRFRNLYSKSVLDRYNELTRTFPDVHQRVSQKILASYLNITPVHLSRLRAKK